MILANRPNLAMLDQLEMDTPEIAEMLRDDPDAYQKRTTFSGLRAEVCNTVQRPEIKVGVMGYPEKASVEIGRMNLDDAVRTMVPPLQKAIEKAAEGRKTGELIEMIDSEKLKMLKL